MEEERKISTSPNWATRAIFAEEKGYANKHPKQDWHKKMSKEKEKFLSKVA